MPVPARTPAELTPAATPLIRRSRGRLASDEAQAAGRIADYLGEADRAPLGELIRACDLSPQVLGALVRCGALVLHTDIAPGTCERCGATRCQSALCDSCRAHLSGARRAPEPAAAVSPRPRRPDAEPVRSRGMRTRRR